MLRAGMKQKHKQQSKQSTRDLKLNTMKRKMQGFGEMMLTKEAIFNQC